MYSPGRRQCPNIYNVLNKTDKITITTATNRWIDYTYDGSGSVIRKRVYDNNVLQTTTDYIGGFVYINSVLAYLPMPEGRVVNNAGTLSPEYILTDLQGNARISFNNTGTGGTAKVVQENSYTGFGLILANSAVTGGTNKNLYNGGSEWQNDYSNLPDYYQTFYRNYDAAIGRFVAVDPMPESAESMTPYQYAENNPVMMNDPGGDAAPRNWRSTDSFSYDWSGRGFPDGDDTYGGGGGGSGGAGGPTLSGWYQDQFANSDGFQNWGGNGIDYQAIAAEHANYISFLNSFASGVGEANGGMNFTLTGDNLEQIYSAWNTAGPYGETILTLNDDGTVGLATHNETASTGTGLQGSLSYTILQGATNIGVGQGDPYSYAGTYYHIPVDANHPIPSPGLTQTQINNNTCVFWAMQYATTYYGGSKGALEIMNNYASLTGKNFGYYFDKGVSVDSNGDELTPLLTSNFSGYYAIDNAGIAYALGKYPVLGYIPTGANQGHEVFVTGINNNYEFSYFDPQLGSYGQTYHIFMPFIVTGLKQN